MRCTREEMKGHILKRVVTRIDYQDIFDISKTTLKKIYKHSSRHHLNQQGMRQLESNDFQLNDPSGISVPIEYIKEVKSHVFYDKDDSYYLEINPLFLRIVQIVDKDYKNFSHTISLLSPVISILIADEEIQINRFSIKKANQVIFKDLNEVINYFKSSVVGIEPFNEFADWNHGGSKTHLVQNFDFNNAKTNIVRVFDSGLINDEKFYRFYLELESYSRNKISDVNEMKSEIVRLNDNIFKLFEFSLTDKGVEMLKSGDKLGEYDDSVIF